MVKRPSLDRLQREPSHMWRGRHGPSRRNRLDMGNPAFGSANCACLDATSAKRLAKGNLRANSAMRAHSVARTWEQYTSGENSVQNLPSFSSQRGSRCGDARRCLATGYPAPQPFGPNRGLLSGFKVVSAILGGLQASGPLPTQAGNCYKCVPPDASTELAKRVGKSKTQGVGNQEPSIPSPDPI